MNQESLNNGVEKIRWRFPASKVNLLRLLNTETKCVFSLGDVYAEPGIY